MGYPPLFAAVHRGFFKDENIDIEIPMMLPQLAHSAFLAGEIDYHGVADSALRLAARGVPLKSIFSGSSSEGGPRFHTQQIQIAERSIADVPLKKIVTLRCSKRSAGSRKNDQRTIEMGG